MLGINFVPKHLIFLTPNAPNKSMKKPFLLLCLVAVSFFSIQFTTASDSQNAVSSRDIINNMLGSISRTNALQFTLKSWERVNGKDNYSEVDCKMTVSPFRLYIYSKAKPNEDVQIIYNEAKYGKKAHINPGAWLPNVNLDPYGSKMRKGQHHTIMNSGFTFLSSIIKAAVARADQRAAGEFDKYFVYEGDVVWSGRKCYKMVINDPEFSYVNHTVKAGETIESIAKSRNICGYLIVEKNKLSGFDDISTGQTLKLPTSYAKKTVLYIDQQHNLPIVQIMYDEVGQFERYEFHSLVPNAKIDEGVFNDFK